jgi:uncharacterized protein YkwD
MARTAGPWGSAVLAAGLAAVLAGCGGGGGPGGPTAPAPAPAAAGTSAVGTGATPSATTASATAGGASAGAATPASVTKTFADQVLEAVNAARATTRKCGSADHPAVGPLRWQVQIEQAALAHAQFLQQNNLFSHTGANGSTVGDRVTATGYVWQTVGENIAAGYPDLAAVVQGWIDSPSHCVNVMNGNFTDLGVVVVQGTSSNTYRNYWAMVLGRPR